MPPSVDPKGRARSVQSPPPERATERETPTQEERCSYSSRRKSEWPERERKKVKGTDGRVEKFGGGKFCGFFVPWPQMTVHKYTCVELALFLS